MLTSVKLGADFSRGCARPAMQPLISTTHPHLATQAGALLVGTHLVAATISCHNLVYVVV